MELCTFHPLLLLFNAFNPQKLKSSPDSRFGVLLVFTHFKVPRPESFNSLLIKRYPHYEEHFKITKMPVKKVLQ